MGIVGPVIEQPDFWVGLDVTHASADWLDHAAVVVLPAWIEHWPRRLLQAVAAGVPVIATTSCGLAGISGVTEISPGDIDSLGKEIREAIARKGDLAESNRILSARSQGGRDKLVPPAEHRDPD
jgi:glycosyltransferase involved in cell wall biosynthesis